MAHTSSGSPKARVLGAELRDVREKAGFGLREFARLLGSSHVKLTRFEAGTRVPQPEDVAAYLTAAGLGERQREPIIEMARNIGEPNWLTGLPSIHHQTMSIIEFERTATGIVDVAPLLIPGLLQTSGYAHAVMSDLPHGEAESRVAMRVNRKEVLNGRNAVKFQAVITENALRTPLGGNSVLLEQLDHILEMTSRDNVDVLVIPDGRTTWNLALEGSITLFTFEKADPIVYLEHYRSHAFIYDAKDIRDYADAVAVLLDNAMSPEESTRRIKEIAHEIGEGTN